MLRATKSNRGSFLIEAVMLTIPFILMLFVILESFRREILQVLMMHIACVEVRGLSLGDSVRDIERNTKEFLEFSLGKELGNKIWKATKRDFVRVTEPEQLRWLKIGKVPGGLVERWLRYEQFISFVFKGQNKHHQEIVKRCLFPFS